MVILIWQKFFMEVRHMIRIDKLEAFSLVVRLVEMNENKMANELMKIISRSIEEDKKNKHFSQSIEIKNKKDEKFVAGLLKAQGN